MLDSISVKHAIFDNVLYYMHLQHKQQNTKNCHSYHVHNFLDEKLSSGHWKQNGGNEAMISILDAHKYKIPT